MPKRKTLEEVKHEIDILSNHTIEVLSTEYINTKTPLLLRNNKGLIFTRDYEHLKRGQFSPNREAVNKKLSSYFRLNIEDVIDYINNSGCEYVSGEYKNTDSKLLIKCRCGNLFKKSFKKFKCGQDRCPECGKESSRQSKIKYSEEDAKKILNEYGYVMIGEYIDAAHPVECLCKNNHNFKITLSYLIYKRHTGCLQCALDNRKGENHPNYKGGISIISDSIRNGLNQWKKSIRELYNGKCPLTNKSGLDAEVHHLYSLSNIIQNVLNEFQLDLNVRDIISDYPSELLDKLILAVCDKHNFQSGILISKEIHIQYHSLYGYGNNTPQQFDEFLNKYYSISLKDILLP